MNYDDLILNFTSVIYEALPFVVLGVVLAGILEEFVPQQLMANLFQRGDKSHLPAFLRPVAGVLQFRFISIALGGLLGLVFPMCECGIIAIMRRLIRKGVPLSVCVCYILVGPILNVVVLLSTYVAFNPPQPNDVLFPIPEDSPFRFLHGAQMVVILRAGLGFLVGYVTSFVVEWQYQKYGDRLLHPSLIVQLKQAGSDEPAVNRPKPRPPLGQRIGNIAETSLHDFVDIMAFLVIGAALAALGREYINSSDLERIVRDSPALSILGMMALAVLFCICSEADAFIATSFGRAMPPAAKIAFIVFGPMVDLKLYFMYTRVFRQRLIWTIFLTVALQVFAYTMLLHYLWPENGYPISLHKSVSSQTTP
jgi:uncharacterized membrane protein YraQ (UPF0718 family)